jgi:phospholipid/cholesterol/gamma-HCH transport system substrate-binding protein
VIGPTSAKSSHIITITDAADEVRALFDRVRPTLPIVLANLVSLGEIAVAYQPSLEQLIVLLPQGTAVNQAVGVHKRTTKQDYQGDMLTLNLNLNIPPPCTTGFLPVQQQRPPTFQDYPDRPPGDVYCRIPQDAPFNVRATCPARPSRANVPRRRSCVKATSTTCRSTTATTGRATRTQPCPASPFRSCRRVRHLREQLRRPDAAPPPIAAAEYDPATGTYVGPDGRVYTQSNLARSATEEQTWQTMVLPPTGN